jgi:hypothetical protein
MKGTTMKKLIVSLVLFASGVAMAACPTFQPYRCIQGANGKMICGCGI